MEETKPIEGEGEESPTVGAIRDRNAERLMVLAKHGTLENVTAEDGTTALMIAALEGHRELATLL